jgi:DUF1016 N-terminal domain
MPRKKDALTFAPETLYSDIRAVLEAARSSAFRAVNTAMVQAYWQIGGLIVEHEQGGRKRAAYGEAVLGDLSQRLTADFGRGFDVTNLRRMRQFIECSRFETQCGSNWERRNGTQCGSFQSGRTIATRRVMH